VTEKLLNFERLAERRVNEVIKKMRLIGNLANRSNYSYTDKHAKQIIDALENEIKFLKAKFRGEDQSGDNFVFRK
jgi:hypothetical protein